MWKTLLHRRAEALVIEVSNDNQVRSFNNRCMDEIYLFVNISLQAFSLVGPQIKH